MKDPQVRIGLGRPRSSNGRDWRRPEAHARRAMSKATSRGDSTMSKATPRGDSMIASAGSNFYGKAAPFGTSVQRFSPSATFAHHAPKLKPQFSSATNRKWVPRALADQPAAALSELKGTPVSDRLAGPTEEPPGGRDGASEHSAAVSSSAFSSASTRQRQQQQRPMSARSARDEQRLSRQLRAEITQMREEKLAAARDARCANGGSGDGGGRCGTLTPRGPTLTVVGLDRLDGACHPGDEPLARLARVGALRGDENAPPPSRGVRIAGRSGGSESEEISPEYASLLSFVAGEARRR